MIIVLCILLSIAVFIALPLIVIFYICPYQEFNNHAKQAGNTLSPMTFHEFLSFYSVNPEKWNGNDEECIYVKPMMETGGFYWHSENRYYVTWDSLFDYIKYKRFLKACRKEKERKFKIHKAEAENKNLQEVLKDIQKDIDKTRAKATTELDKAKQMTEKVEENIRDKKDKDYKLELRTTANGDIVALYSKIPNGEKEISYVNNGKS